MNRDSVLLGWLKQLPVDRKWHWLDLGAGSGELSQQIQKLWRNSTFVALDVKPQGGHIQRFDGKHIPAPDHSFDFVVINYVLQHAGANAEMLILEAARVTRSAILIQDETDVLSITHWVEMFKTLLPSCSIICTPYADQPCAFFVLSPQSVS